MTSNTKTLAAVQFAPVLGESDLNRATSIGLIEQAAFEGARLIVLPECCISGCLFSSRNELEPFAETIAGPSVNAWQAASQRTGAWIVAGLAERAGGHIYNSAVLIGPNGELHVYRKIHLWNTERELYDAGSDPVCVQTPLGIIGLAICYDLWFPELSRKLTLAGASIIAVPANWHKNPKIQSGLDRHGYPLGYYVASATACVNELVVICADRVGEEAGEQFLGGSCIFGPAGRELTHPAGPAESTIIYSELPDVQGTRGLGRSHLLSRRPEIYERDVLAGCPIGSHTVPDYS